MDNSLNYKKIILILFILVLIFISLILVVKKMMIGNQENISNNTNNTTGNEVNIAQNKEQETLEKLKSMTERERMEYYFSEFMDHIESENYQEAYNLLYPEFKDTYFKTLDDFEKYVKKTYPDFVSFSYNDISRQGYIYVLTITVINPDSSKDEAKKSQRIVIKENDFNDFVLSFQVI